LALNEKHQGHQFQLLIYLTSSREFDI